MIPVTKDEADRVMALWLLFRPEIEDTAKRFGATPEQATLALTMGLPMMVLGASPDGREVEYLGKAAALFEHCCKMCLEMKGDN